VPLFESACEECRITVEWMGKYDAPEPFCGGCGHEMHRLPSKFKVIWTGAMSASKYGDSKLGNNFDSHTAYRIKTSRSGAPEPVLIDSWQKRKEFMKAEGLVGVEDLGSDFQPSSDGMRPGTAPVGDATDPGIEIKREL
jgi:hypothetical protein